MRAFFASLTDIAGATSVSDSSSIGALNKLIALFGNFDEAESASDPNSEFKIATLMDMGILELRSTYLSSLIDWKIRLGAFGIHISEGFCCFGVRKSLIFLFWFIFIEVLTICISNLCSDAKPIYVHIACYKKDLAIFCTAPVCKYRFLSEVIKVLLPIRSSNFSSKSLFVNFEFWTLITVFYASAELFQNFLCLFIFWPIRRH